MARPRKARYCHCCGKYLLPPNLYNDNRKPPRPGYWIYHRPDGSRKTFQCEDPQEAIKHAEQANKVGMMQVKTKVPARDSIIRQVELYIEYREELAPKLKQKESWKNYQRYLRGLAEQFSNTPVHKMELPKIEAWWNTLTGHAQRSRRAEFNKFFNFLMLKEVVPRLKGNPFSTSDDRPRVLLKPIADKTTQRLGIDDFWRIYRAAGELGLGFVQIGMGICLTTTLRRGDIMRLTFEDNIIDNHLVTSVSKSHEKAVRGEGVNIRLDLSKHTRLAKIINRAREMSLRNRRCPYIISHRYEKLHKVSGDKTHKFQVLPRYFSDSFALARDHAGVHKEFEKKDRGGIHEVRSLASFLLKKAGHDAESVRALMAHTDISMTKHYQLGHEVEYTDVGISINDEIIGGSF